MSAQSPAGQSSARPARIALAPGLAAATPTSEGVAEALAPEDIAGRPIGVQLYPGDGPNALLATLQTRGAVLTRVTPYRYASQAETAQVVGAIEEMSRDRLSIAFGQYAASRTPLPCREKAGSGRSLSRIRTLDDSFIGPVLEEALHCHGFSKWRSRKPPSI